MSEIEGDTTADHAAVEPDQSPVAHSGAADASPSRTADASPAREPSLNTVQAGASSRPQNTSTTTTEAREPSPNPAQAVASSEQRNTSTVTEAAETRSRTINLTERARQNRQARFQQRAQPPATARGRGQQSATQRVWLPTFFILVPVAVCLYQALKLIERLLFFCRKMLLAEDPGGEGGVRPRNVGCLSSRAGILFCPRIH